jgi:hypothetical protein
MKKIVVTAVVLGVLATFAFGATYAFAQGPTQPYPWGGRGGMMGGLGYNADWQIKMQEATAQAMGLTLDQLNAELRAGKTLAQIAEAKKLDPAKVYDAIQVAHKALLQQAVKDGKLTQVQADAMIARQDAMNKYWDANGGVPPMWSGNYPQGRMPMRGWNGTNPGYPMGGPRGGMWGTR